MKLTIPQIQAMKKSAQKIAMLTAYDYTFARILDQTGIDLVLVGDSLGMVVQGHRNTLPVTVDEMIYHTRLVSRGLTRAHLVCDMPFLSYQASLEEAVQNCGRALKEGRAESVKLEGGEEIAETVHKLTTLGIPVMGHIGLKPMHVHLMGGYKIQGKDEKSENQILREAKILQQAGAYALVVEGIPSALAHTLSQSIQIPTIGIGSGVHCDGQVLVIYDLLGFYQDIKPKFVRRYLEGFSLVSGAVQKYIEDVRSQNFPSKKESF